METHWMMRALEEAQKAYDMGETPVGAVAVLDNELLVTAHNLIESLRDASAHAELLVMKKAAAILGRRRLTDVDLYITIEPCPMCAMAMVLFRIRKLTYGAAEPRTGAAGSMIDLLGDSRLNHRVEVQTGICSKEAGELMKSFFRERRGGNFPKNRVDV